MPSDLEQALPEPRPIRNRTEDGLVEVRCVKLSREQFNAIGKLVSIASRIGGTYEVYGGVNIAEALGHHNTFEGQWYDARTTATLEPASDYEPILDV